MTPTLSITPPDLVQPLITASRYAPSWTGPLADTPFINGQHRAVFDVTRMVPGWQDAADSQKLYEIAYHNGSVILEIGVYGGKSAAVELLGALAGALDRGLPAPQLYGLDVATDAIARGRDSLTDAGLLEHALLFHGNLGAFLSQIPITPTMVFVDGDHTYQGCHADLTTLALRLLPGTPVMCHDYGGIQGVRQAVDEIVRAGGFEKMGCFASSILLKATGRPTADRPARPQGLTPATFRAVRHALLEHYAAASGAETDPITEPARNEIFGTHGGWHEPGTMAADSGVPIAIREPDVARATRQGFAFLPSWTSTEPHDLTPVPGDAPGSFRADARKILEAAYHNGGVMLAVGLRDSWTGPVALRGALAQHSDPQFFGLDTDASNVRRVAAALGRSGLLERALLYHGNIGEFLAELPITPSLVISNPEPGYSPFWLALRALGPRLAPGTPILLLNAATCEGAALAINDFARVGIIERMGRFGVSILLRTPVLPGRGVPAEARGLSAGQFRTTREVIFREFAGGGLNVGKTESPVADLTAGATAELVGTESALTAAPTDERSRLTLVARVGMNVEETRRSLASISAGPDLETLIVDRGGPASSLIRANGFTGEVLSEQQWGRIGAAKRIAQRATGRRIIWIEEGETLPVGALDAVAAALRDDDLRPGYRKPIEELLGPGNSSLSAKVFHADELGRDPAWARHAYNLARDHGEVILSIGLLGGAAGLIELRGALSATRTPQFFGLDPDRGAVERSRAHLERAGLLSRAILFHGPLQDFAQELPIKPTLILLNGYFSQDHCRDLLRQVRALAMPGTPILACRYARASGVRAAVDEACSDGSFHLIGTRGIGMLISGGESVARRRTLSPQVFHDTRMALLGRLLEPPKDLSTRSLATAAARGELARPGESRVASGRSSWPFARQEVPLPATMPSGKPWPRISIVTPSFNQGKYIEETLLSVRNQGYPDVEHIVMDGGSTDDTLDIVDRYRDGLAHIVSRKDKGQSDAINRGFKLATGNILTWLNSDDMLAPGALAAVALAFEQSGADLVAGECHIYRDGKFEARHLTSCANGPLPLEDLLDIDGSWLEGQFFYQPEVMFTRRAWERAGARVSDDLYHSMDYELWLRMAESGSKLHVIGRPVALFRAHAEQKTAGEVVGGFRVELPKARDAFLARSGRTWTPPVREPRKDRLRIVLFNDLGFAYGAGIAHKRLAEAFLAAGHHVFPIAASLTDYHAASPKTSHRETVEKIASYLPDLVVVGNLHGAAVEPGVLAAIAARFPTAFVLHDMWMLTGRCAYTGDCRKYLTRCDGGCSCAQVHPLMKGDLIGPAWDVKRRVLGGASSLGLWANSEWMRLKASEALSGPGALAGPRPETIKFGFELDTFRPRDKHACRDVLGLPRDKFIIMSSASSLADPRKGLSHLAEAMTRARIADALVVAVGWFGADESAPIPGMRAMGYMKDPQRLATLYSAADLFVGPSLEEAFGQVYIEAAACGTPSVGYPVGGKPESICDGVSGRLALANNPGALAEAITELYRDRELRESMSRWGRIWAENEWSMTASFHRLFNVLQKQDLVPGLGRRLNLAVQPGRVPEVAALGPTVPGWRAVSGFDVWEGPYPERGIGRCRWALGPSAAFEMDSVRGGRATVLVSCRCFEHGQRIRLMQGHLAIGERDLPADPAAHTDRVLSFEVHLAAGVNHFELQFWKWNHSGRPMAILVTGITAIPIGASAPVVQLPVVETKPRSDASSRA